MPARKNVLLIVVDQWRGLMLPKLGADYLKLPNLDRLCAEGVTFANHFTQAVPCGPAPCVWRSAICFRATVSTPGSSTGAGFVNTSRTPSCAASAPPTGAAFAGQSSSPAQSWR